MACGARSGLKHPEWASHAPALCCGRNGLWSPFGFETDRFHLLLPLQGCRNGLWSPFGFETLMHTTVALVAAEEEPSPPFTSRFFIKPPPEPDELWPSCFSFWEPKAWLATVPARSDPRPIHPLGSTSRRW